MSGGAIDSTPATSATLHADFRRAIATIDRHVYGHFTEHLGACVYGGIWAEDGSPVSTTRGIRTDALRLIAALRPGNIRWPGGCFSEYYHWEEGIGSRGRRPLTYDFFWNKPEPNTVGTHEFIDLCRLVGAEPVIAVNVRTGTPAEAAAWVAYCNEPADGPQGSRRAANGHPEPFGVRIWDVGNEGWDLGAEWYAHRFLEYARAMRAVDPAIKLVAVGHNGGRRDRAWDETIVRIAGREIDAIAPHHYVGHRVKSLDGDGVHYYANVACAKPVEETLAFDVQLLDSQLPDRPEVAIAMDEWGVWTQIDQGMRHNYDLSDALVAAAVLNAIQRQARRVRIANWAQIVDCLGLIQARRDLVWTTPVYEAYRLYATICGAEVCPCVVTCATYDTGPVAGLRRPLPPITDVPYLDAGATRDPDGRRVVLTVVNRHLTQPMDCHLDLAGLPPDPVIRVEELNHPDVFAMNTAGAPTTIQVIERTLSSLGATFRFPAHSLTVIELRSR